MYPIIIQRPWERNDPSLQRMQQEFIEQAKAHRAGQIARAEVSEQTDTLVDEAQAMRDDGVSVRDIAEATGMSRSWVSKYTINPKAA